MTMQSKPLLRTATDSKCPMLWLLGLLMQASVAAASSVQNLARFQFNPAYVHDLVEGKNRTVRITVTFDKEILEAAGYDKSNLRMSINPLHHTIASVDTPNVIFRPKNAIMSSNTSEVSYHTDTTVFAHFLGKTALEVKLVTVDDNNTNDFEDLMELEVDRDIKFSLSPTKKSSSRMDLWIRRPEDLDFFSKIFVSTLITLITVANILMGCDLDIGSVFATIKKPTAPLIGMFTQFGIMPIIAYCVSQLILVSRGLHSFALGLFVTGCAPGGGASNFWTLLLDGNVNLSVSMTFISTLASIVTIPFWMKVLGYKFLQDYTETVVKVPYGNIIRGLFVLVIPLLIGIAIRKYKPNVAAKARGILRPFIIFVLLFVVGFGIAVNFYMFKLLTLPALLAGLLLPWCGFMFGCFTALLLRQKPEDVSTIAIETGVQNTGIAIMLLKFSFSQPDSDISSLIPVIVACFTPGPLLLGYGVHMFIKFLKERKNGRLDIEKDHTSVVAFNPSSVSPFTLKSPGSPLRHKVQDDDSNRPLIRNQQISTCNTSEDLSEADRVAYMVQLLEQVSEIGVIPD